jgi:hypothetical protein
LLPSPYCIDDLAVGQVPRLAWPDHQFLRHVTGDPDFHALFVRAYVPLTPGIGGRSRPDGRAPCVMIGREHPPGRFKVVGEEDFPIGRIDAGAEPESFEPQALDRGSLADQPIDLGPIRAVDWQMKMGDALL